MINIQFNCLDDLIGDIIKCNTVFEQHVLTCAKPIEMKLYYSWVRKEISSLYHLDKGEYTHYYAVARGRYNE